MFNLVQHNYKSDLIDTPFFKFGFGTKHTSKLDYQFPLIQNIINLHQVHGDQISVIDSYKSDLLMTSDKADGLITSLKNIVLVIKTADCVPIIFFDEVKRRIGISHQGYKGTLLKLSEKMVKKMQDLGSDIKDIKALIGPAICEKCYIITGKRLKEFKEKFVIKDDLINLKELNRKILLSSGLRKENIDMSLLCTSCNSDLFYSYKRDQTHTWMVNFVFLYNKSHEINKGI